MVQQVSNPTPEYTGNSYLTPQLSQATTYYVSKRNSITGCESQSRIQGNVYWSPPADLPGETTLNTTGTYTYTFTDDASLAGASWQITNGTKLNETIPNSFTRTVDVRWTAPGAGQVKLIEGSWVHAQKNITVVCTTPVTPAYTVYKNTESGFIPVGNGSCGPAIFKIDATAGANADKVRWYTTETSEPHFREDVTFTTEQLPSTTSYFIKSYNSASGCSSARIPLTATVNSIPSGTATVIGNTRFGEGTLTLSASGTPSGGGYRWYNPSNALVDSDADYLTPSITSTQANYTYVKFINSAGCEGSPSWISVTIEPLPVITTSNPVATLNTPVTLSANAGYSSYTWKNSVASTVGSSQQFSTAIKGNYTVTVTKAGIGGSGTSLPFYVQGQFDGINMNYIASHVMLREIRDANKIENLPVDSVSQTIQYFDGLGRLTQTVSTQASPSKNDIVVPVVYDASGREFRTYLPFVPTEKTGHYKNNVINPATGEYIGIANTYSSGIGNIPIDSKPFAEKLFEQSPLDRVLKQGAPGADWQPNASTYSAPTDRSIKSSYEFNAANEVLLWTYSSPTPSFPLGLVNASNGSTPVYYAANELFKKRTKDEHHNEVIEYIDKNGLIVLKRVQAVAGTPVINDVNYASTYYVYDALRNLVAVIAPEATKLIVGSPSEYFGKTDSEKNIFLKQWAFRYTIDSRNRQNQEQLPGTETIYMVYDNHDRLVLTQDGNQRNLASPEWTFTKYDELDRPVLTGKYASANDLIAMQTAVNTYYNNLTSAQAWFETYIASGINNVLGYDNKSFPQVSTESSYLTAAYYDRYDSFIVPSGYSYLTQSLPGQETINSLYVNGQTTVTLVKNLVSGSWMRNVNYYDKKFRLIQSVGDHHKGIIRTGNVYDFIGKVLYSKRDYVVNGVTTEIKETLVYDHGGRLQTTKHSINGAGDVILNKNEYNELGQLIDKKLHSTDGTTFKQSVDNRYNIRGWLTHINQADVGPVAPGDVLADMFGMELSYNNTPGGFTSSAAYNGNISAIQWSKGYGGNVSRHSYSFSYDVMNRLLNANHYDYKTSTATWLSNNKSYSERILEYDLSGNIKKLSRRSFGGTLMDSLIYSYTGNQLNFVHDYGNAGEGYINTNTGSDDYSYDFNGNLDKDKNKGLIAKGDIKYNYLNLPQEVIKGTEKVKYIYDATGRKLAQEVYSGSTLVKYTDYIGELVYEGNVLQFIQHSEGRYLPIGGGEYQYHMKDHLGNVRVTFTSKPQNTVNYSTNFEAGNTGAFKNFINVTPFDLMDHTDAGTVYTKIQWLGGGSNGRVGLAKSMAVMPGDEVSISAYGKYFPQGSGSPASFAAALAAAFNVSSSSIGEDLKIYNGLNSYASTVVGGDHLNDDESAPKAFVTILFFDKNYNLLDAAWDQITTVGEQTDPFFKQPPHDLLSVTAKAPEAGYAYVFLSNEHPNYVDVYFDDVAVNHTPSPIVSSSDYFPFGLTFNSSYSRENSVDQNYLYNGKELQDELNLGWYDYLARQYDPTIGRFLAVDPAAEAVRRWSTYSYAADNPIRFIDPDGMLFTDFIDEDGNKTHVEDGSNAVFEIKKDVNGFDQRKHYEFKEYDESQGGKNEVNVETVIQEQQKYNLANEDLQQESDGTTYCNYATQNIMDAVGSATGQSITITGRGNDMAEKLQTDNRYQSVDQATAEATAADGGLALMAFRNYEKRKDGSFKSGHLATFSVGENIAKGKAVNIGTAEYTGFQPKATSFFKKTDFATVKFYILKTSPQASSSTVKQIITTINGICD